MFVAGCVGVYSDSHIDVFGGLVAEENPWVSDLRMAQSGGMVVWDKDDFGDAPPQDWLTRYPTAELMEPIVYKTHALTGDVDAEVGVIIVHPAGKSKSVEIWASKPVSSGTKLR